MTAARQLLVYKLLNLGLKVHAPVYGRCEDDVLLCVLGDGSVVDGYLLLN